MLYVCMFNIIIFLIYKILKKHTNSFHFLLTFAPKSVIIPHLKDKEVKVMKDTILSLLENRHTAQFKAVVNLIIAPAILFYLTGSMLSSAMWIIFVSWVYKVYKRDTENGRVFFQFMSNIVVGLALMLCLYAFVVLVSIL